MNKEKIILAILKSFIIGVFILIGSFIISNSQRYQLISHGESEIIIIDTKTGEYYSKMDLSSEGYANWREEENPFD